MSRWTVMGLLLVDLFTIGLILGGGYKISRAEAGLHLAQTGGNLQQGGRCGGCTYNVMVLTITIVAERRRTAAGPAVAVSTFLSSTPLTSRRRAEWKVRT